MGGWEIEQICELSSPRACKLQGYLALIKSSVKAELLIVGSLEAGPL